MKNSEDSLRDFWHNIFESIFALPGRDTGRRKDRKGGESIFKEIMPENFPNMEKKTNAQSQESQKFP